MSSRTASEAVRLHLQRTQQLIASVTGSVLRVRGDPRSPDQRAIGFPGASADLSGVRLKLVVTQHFRTFDFASGYTLIVVGYQYTLVDAGEHEILAYHWHPSGPSRITQPHLHLGSAAQVKQRDLAAAHLPTGLITLAGVVEMLIGSFGVVPRIQGWRDVVAAARAI